MPVTTFLHDGELNQPTGDSEIDELLAEARAKSGEDYQIVLHNEMTSSGLFGLRKVITKRPVLHVFVGGCGPWQVLTCASNTTSVRAYLIGLINGHDNATRTN